MTVPAMVDLSSNNGPPDLPAHYRAGYRTIALKATEGTNYDWAAHNGYTVQWHKLGGGANHYHFGRAGDPRAQARWFASQIRSTFDRRHDYVTIDAETHGVDGAFVRAFIDTIISELGNVKGLIYGSPSFLNANGIRKYRGWRLWLAEYGPHADVPRSWLTWMAWQWTDKATNIPGIPGAVDLSHVKGWLLPGVARPAVLYPRLKQGASGPWVHKMQALLNAHGAKLIIDGAFGPATRSALNVFKKAHRLPVNGVCGPGAWWALTR